jgi:UDP-N-acetylglucosamine diphosphorylase / glucose-1-phosphate thymidylyltransferase / UDP-N-acetylgalactosamine diphosphorylase / glucosamine-1-phosphate N-acetyltransferase / galactosamine-1-phosphate N-acetyltransferase
MIKTAVILAAGEGKKMWPYSSTRQKAALPLANKPIIRWQVEKLHRAGVENIIVVVGYRKQQVVNALAGIDNIVFVDQEGTGTTGALLSGLKHVDDDSFILLYGDVVLTFDEIQKFCDSSGDAIFSALVNPLGSELPQNWICASVTNDNIDAVLGHPRDDVTHRFAGMFALSKSFLPYVKRTMDSMQSVQVGMMPPEEPQFEDAIQAAIDNGETVRAVQASNRAFDIDKPWHYLEASYYWNEYVCGKIEHDVIGKGAKVSDGADISGRLVLGDNVEIGKGVIIEGNLVAGADTKIIQGAILDKNIIVGKRCTIRRYCQIENNSTIGPDCFIGHGAEVAGLLLRRVFAYHYGEFWGIIGDNSDLGAATVCGNLRFDDQATIHNSGEHRETPGFGANAAYLGDFVRTGVNAIIMPGIKVGSYSVIGAGAQVMKDVEERTLLYVKQEQEKREWGPEKYGW